MLISDPTVLLSAFLLGFMGSGHCIGMCGGLAAALGMNTPKREHSSLSLVLGYNVGRISSYCIAGLIVGSLGFWLTQQTAALTILRYLAALMLILMGLYLGQWFNGILWTEKLGKKLWPFIQPLSKRFIPIKNTRDALIVGMVWGWLPCGLVYSALIWSSLEASISGSLLIMLAFGTGTLPSMLASGLFAEQLGRTLKKKSFRITAGALMILFGLWTMPITQSTFYQIIAK